MGLDEASAGIIVENDSVGVFVRHWAFLFFLENWYLGRKQSQHDSRKKWKEPRRGEKSVGGELLDMDGLRGIKTVINERETHYHTLTCTE
jgi:hypothetical protein